MSDQKAVLGLIAILITVIVFLPYIHGILRNKIKPHVFSWIIWSITTWIAFFAQLTDDAGFGAWPIACSAFITSLIAWIAWLRQADISITRLDWLFLLTALASLPLWYFTNNPVWAVIIITVIDLLGFGPTLRKVYHEPYSESPIFFGIYVIRNIIVILALEHYSVTTVLFPAAIAVACSILIIIILFRRRFAVQELHR